MTRQCNALHLISTSDVSSFAGCPQEANLQEVLIPLRPQELLRTRPAKPTKQERLRCGSITADQLHETPNTSRAVAVGFPGDQGGIDLDKLLDMSNQAGFHWASAPSHTFHTGRVREYTFLYRLSHVACLSRSLSLSVSLCVSLSLSFFLSLSLSLSLSLFVQDLMELFCARQRRKFSRGIKRKLWPWSSEAVRGLEPPGVRANLQILSGQSPCSRSCARPGRHGPTPTLDSSRSPHFVPV